MLHQQVSARHLGLIRIAVFGAFFFYILFDHFADMAGISLALIHPAGVLRFFPDSIWPFMWTSTGIWALKIPILVGLGCLTLGTRGFHWIAAATLLLMAFY